MDRNTWATVIVLNWLGASSFAGVVAVGVLSYHGQDTPTVLATTLATALGALVMACPAILPRNGNGTYPAPQQPEPTPSPGSK